MIEGAPEFQPFPKVPRLNRGVVVTEKIDGTNAAIHVTEEGQVFAGSRNRWITTKDDNHGFARWVEEHAIEIAHGLGPGTHFGEWWGSGVQRGYGLTKGEKRFSLFNTARWNHETPPPECCNVVPVLAVLALFDTSTIRHLLAELEAAGSQAAPGFMDPEGIVIYHAASRSLFKATLHGDEVPKGMAA